jgi:hypothetical protein
MTILWARLDLANIEAAKRELARREGIEPRHTDSNIGFWTPERASPHLEAEKIGAWAKECNLDGVVWTALRPKFGNAYRIPTEREIVDYLAGLKGEVRTQAETYCRLAPPQIRTPYRAAIEAALDWGYNGDMTQGTDTTTRRGDKPVEYPFQGASEQTHYRVFPDKLEDDELIAFHGTAETNLKPIIDGGFSFVGTLQSLSFARNSSLALKYACDARTGASPNGCILAVRFPSLEKVVAESAVIHVYKLDLQPKIIGYCIIPASYRFI